MDTSRPIPSDFPALDFAPLGALFGNIALAAREATDRIRAVFDLTFNQAPVIESPALAEGKTVYDRQHRRIFMNPRDAIRLQCRIPRGPHGDLDVSLILINRRIDQRTEAALARIDGMYRDA